MAAKPPRAEGSASAAPVPSPLYLYWFDLDRPPASTTGASDWLSPEERARAARFVFPEHGRRFITAHAQLRWLLARHLGCAPADLRFEPGANGKPALSGTPLHFNLSHSGHYALVGIHPSREVGVDIEAERRHPSFDPLALAHRFFTPAETAWLAAHAVAARARAFCRLWTCKEAWMKAEGGGMALLSQVEVAFSAAGAQLRQLGPPPRAWFVREIDLVPGYAAAAVMKESPAAIMVAAHEPTATPPAPA